MDKVKLIRKTDTTLVYIASDEFAKEIMKDKYHKTIDLYIHVSRDKGAVFVYKDNDKNKPVFLELEERELILKYVEADRWGVYIVNSI